MSCGSTAWASLSPAQQTNYGNARVNYWLNSVLQSPSVSAGMNVFVFNPATVFNGFVDYRAYDTASVSTDSAALVAYLGSIASGRLVVLACHGNCVGQLSTPAKNAIGAVCGATDINALGSGDSYLCIYHVGRAVTLFSGRSASGCVSRDLGKWC